MKRAGGLLAIIWIVTSMFFPVGAVTYGDERFQVAIYVRVNEQVLNGTHVAYGIFNVYLKFENWSTLGSSDDNLTKIKLHDFVYRSIYLPLIHTLESKFNDLNVSYRLYLPPGGDPVRIGSNGSVVVSFLVVPFFIPNGTYLSTPLGGPIYANISGTLPLKWSRFVVFLSNNFSLVSSSPSPYESKGGVLMWVNGSYIPSITVYNPDYAFFYFVHFTNKTITFSFDPTSHYIHFNATFIGSRPAPDVVERLLNGFRRSMNIVGISARYIPNGVDIFGIAFGQTFYKDERDFKVWTVAIHLPYPFELITVDGGSYLLAPNNTIVLTFKERRKSFLHVSIILGMILLGTIAVLLRYFGRSRVNKNSSDEWV